MRAAHPAAILALLLTACGEKEPSDDVDAALPPLTVDAGPLNDAGAPPPRAFDCAALAATYAASCPDHLGISDDTLACALIHDGQGQGPLQASVGLAAAVCAQAAHACDRIFLCVADEHGLTALTLEAHVTGRATVEGDDFTFDAPGAWAWLATKADGDASDLEVLFRHDGRPWYFKLDDFFERSNEEPYAVDANAPIKLENGEDNVEIVTGAVRVEAFSLPGAFDVRATATDRVTGEVIDLQVRGRFD